MTDLSSLIERTPDDFASLSAPQGEVKRPDAEEDDRSWLGTSIDRIDAMEEAAMLRAALAPFANYAVSALRAKPKAQPDSQPFIEFDGARITLGHLRRAREALALSQTNSQQETAGT